MISTNIKPTFNEPGLTILILRHEYLNPIKPPFREPAIFEYR